MTVIPSFRAWSLKAKFALLSGAMTFAFAGVFTTWTLHTLQSDLVGSVTDEQKALARATADTIDEKIDARLVALVKTADAMSATARAAAGPPLDLEAFFGSQPLLRELFDGIAMVDTAGHFVDDSDKRVGRTGATIQERPYIRQILAGAPHAMSPPFRSRRGDNALLLVFAAPMHTADGRISGALLGSINLMHSNFLGRLSEARIGQGGRFTLIEKGAQPIIVMHVDKRRILAPVDPAGDSKLARALEGFEGTVQGVANGVEALRTTVSLRSAPWVLVAVYPTSEAFAGLHARQHEIVWIAGALCVLASSVAWLMAGWLLRPLQRLQSLMAQHGEDLTAPLQPASFGSAELATLVTAYNAQALQRREFEDRLRASERRMRDITDALPAQIAHIDCEGRYTFVNSRTAQVLGLAPQALLGRDLKDTSGAERYAKIAPYVARALRGEAVSFDCTGTIAGQIHHDQANYLPDRSDSGEVRGFYSMLFDVTPLKEAQARQGQVEQRLRGITDRLPALIAHVDRDQRYDFLNATFKTWLGSDPARALGRPMSEVMAPAVYAARRDKVARCLAGESLSFEWEEELLVGRKVLRIEYLPDVAPNGTVIGFYTFSFDVTELKDAQHSLSLLVRSDSLTGLPNRYQFNEVLPLAAARCARAGLGLGLMFLDIDHFKHINDSFGHAAGDAVLKEFAARLQGAVRRTDLAARLGGDEFVVLLEGLHNDTEPQLVARKVLAEMERPFNVQGRLLTVTTSVGIAYQAAPGEGGAEALALADAALYKAKAGGRNTYRVASA